jgi:hypothetical protein
MKTHVVKLVIAGAAALHIGTVCLTLRSHGTEAFSVSETRFLLMDLIRTSYVNRAIASGLTEQLVRQVIDAFYEKVRRDPQWGRPSLA